MLQNKGFISATLTLQTLVFQTKHRRLVHPFLSDSGGCRARCGLLCLQVYFRAECAATGNRTPQAFDPLSTCEIVLISKKQKEEADDVDECCQVAQCMLCLLLRRSCIFIALSS